MTPEREIDIQASFRKRLYYSAPQVKVVAIPNAARRTPWEVRQAKKEGLASGVPDVICLAPGGLVAWIEFKTSTGRVSDNQHEWLDLLARYGFRAAVCRSVDEAVAFLRECGFVVMERAA